VLQCVAVCEMLYKTSVAGVLQCGAVCCSVLQCTVVCCSMLQCGSVRNALQDECRRCVAMWGSMLQCVAIYCSVLQCAVCCGALR